MTQPPVSATPPVTAGPAAASLQVTAPLVYPTVLVAGASQGIGLGFVQALLQRSQTQRVFALYRNPDSASGLLALSDARLVTIQADLTQESEVAAAFEQIQSHTDRLHQVINCVGVLHGGDLRPEKSLRHIEADRLLQYFQTNSVSAVLLAKYLTPLLKHAEPSLFATISAKVGSIGDNRLGGWYGYRASKAALNMLMKTVAIEYGRVSPRTIVTVLHPGTTDTRLSQPFQRGVPPEKLFSVERTVTQLLHVMDQLTIADSGSFFSWDGSPLPW
ncbi:MAG: SDR family NAD(P)-dependent oxidoreductase [Prochlorothrix sp.]|nr:SDR family NAD(P)-dependent oxidoreductase [Prochlorothrix sp.]